MLFNRSGGAVTAALNRPKALNSLNTDMVRAPGREVGTWAADSRVAVVVLKGVGGKAFCAGGDIKTLWDGRGSPATAEKQDAFFREEYTVDYALARSAAVVPHVALYDGIVMGGGVGISIHAPFRVATEKALFAMPETGIGLFPDVGGSYFLPRLPRALGVYLALSGHRLKGADLVHAGVATHYVAADAVPALERDLAALTPSADRAGAVAAVLARHAAPALPPFSLPDATRDLIADTFTADTVEGIQARLAAVAAAGGATAATAAATAAVLQRMSPTSMKITLEQMRRGATLSLADCYRMELRMALRCMQGHDFFEGVRALLVDKDGKPVWRPATLEAVTPADVAAYFAPLPADKELHLQ